MRSYEKTRELSYESFIETFGKEPINSTTAVIDCKIPSKRNSMFVRSREVASSLLKTQGTKGSSSFQENSNKNTVREDEASPAITSTHKEKRAERMSRKLRKISMRKKDSCKSFVDNKKASAALHRSKSVSFLGKSPPTSNWVSAFHASIHQRVMRRNTAVAVSPVLPMSKMTSTAHKGFLSKKNQKKQAWTRYWCILQDCCLYCYSSPKSEFADDIIAIGGYTLTDVRSSLSLERHGKETYQFKADDAVSQNAWENALVNALYAGKNIRRSVSTKQPLRRKLAPVYERAVSDFCVDVAKVKAKLLEEVLAQQQEIMREKEMLEKMTISKQQSRPMFTSSPAIPQNPAKASSMSSLVQSEDHGYCSSIEGSTHEAYSESDDSKQSSPSSRSSRSMSTVSVASSASLCSIPEERRKSSDVCPKVLAEIEEFQTFSQTIKRRQSHN